MIHRAHKLLGIALVAGLLSLSPSAAVAAGPPLLGDVWVTDVSGTSATLRAEINPNGFATKYRFEYLTEADYLANLAAIPPREGFSGALRAPVVETNIGAGTAYLPALQHVTSLKPVSSYRYRVITVNAGGTVTGPQRIFGTEEASNVFTLPDGRAWELVSPLDKDGGSIQGPEESFGGGVLQAAADGDSLTYSSTFSFTGPGGAPSAGQYLSRRELSGWATANITAPLISGSYGDRPQGVPYQLFSADLSTALMLNGERCRGSDGECPVANPPLPGSGAPAGYQNYYLRGAAGGFKAVLSQAGVAGLRVGPAHFGLRLAGSGGDLSHAVLSSCAALSANATEVPVGEGCDPAAQNLYEWSGSGLSLINLLPGASVGTPGAELAAQSGAVSSDGSRVYWTEGADLYLRDGGQTKWVDESLGGGGSFQTASSDGSLAFFTKADHLYRYSAGTNVATDLTPSGNVKGVLGASADGSRVYYATTTGLSFWDEGANVQIATGVNAVASSNYPPTTGTARISTNGAHLLFNSSAVLTPYDNEGEPEVYLYGPPPGGGAAALICASCNPTGERPGGSSHIPGAYANGVGSGATDSYKPRVLATDGSRVFFESSDAMARQDTNGRLDVYQWEAAGVGSCQRVGGCIGLLSSGRSPQGARFIDASADGSDVFFLTDSSLVATDPGSFDVYDAREGGGLPIPSSPIPCNGDACQALPEGPEDPTPGTLVPNSGNPPAPPQKAKKKKKKHHQKKRHAAKGHRPKGGSK